MKLPKELKKANDNYFTVQEALAEIKNNFSNFSKFSSINKENYLFDLFEKIKPLNSKALYLLVRRFSRLILKDINFICNRCNPSCCNFKSNELVLKEIALYQEDWEYLKNNYSDLKGYVSNYSENYFKQDEESVSKYFNMTLTFDKFNFLRRKSRSILGFFKRLNIVKKEDKNVCYYYDIVNNKCKIHQYKPLVCLTFPLRIQNNPKKFGILKSVDCFWSNNQLLQIGEENFTDFIEKFLNYWLYLFSIWLYLRSKGRFSIKDRKVIEKDELKQVKSLDPS